MKKTLIPLIIVSLFLAWCNSLNKTTYNTQQTKSTITDENKPLINVQEKTKKAEQILKKIWLTGEKLKQELIKQKAWFEIIAKLKWNARKKYVLETQILPQVIKSWKVSKKCTTTNLNNYVACLYATQTPIEKLLKEIPQWTQNLVKKTYYEKIYSLNNTNLLKKTSDPIALQAKKDVLKQMFMNSVLTTTSTCNKLPEQETKDYCKSLFKK